MGKLASINPSNYKELGSVDFSTKAEVKKKVKSARKVAKEWKDIGVSSRVDMLRGFVKEVKKRKKELALIQAQEMGMPMNDALYDVDDSLGYVEWYLDNAHKYLTPEVTFEDDKEIHEVYRDPIGVAGVIIPWNFPFANFVWGAFQGLVSGNTVVMKHSEECLLSAKLIEEIMTSIGLSDGVFSEVYGDGKIGDALVHEDIDMIAFTGSTKTGKYLYEVAGKKFIRAVMELGGSAPGIVFEDADLKLCTAEICDQRLFNAGQCCDGLKRLIVHESVS